MRMSAIYQPIMLMELLKQGGTASVTDIAKAILIHDQSQIEYYEQRVRNMVGRVLTNNRKITEKHKDQYLLKGYEDLSPQETAELIELCQQKVEEFLSQRGDRIWSHRTRSLGYIPGSLKYEVLKRAKFRCELCGAHEDQRALEVDHILPRNHGGTDDPSNLQALCYSCNAMKRDLDDTDLRGIHDSYSHREKGCIFCEIEASRIIAENELCFAIRDGFPVTPLHTLIIPKRHVSDYFDLYQPERNAAQSLMDDLRKDIVQVDPSVSGFNVGINAGESAGQTIFHCHIHLIPRRIGDVEQPRGGVRGVIPGKQGY
jgi:ATP adenylyltransferase